MKTTMIEEHQRKVTERVTPPRSWRNPGNHLATAIEAEWYRHLAVLLDEISWATHAFFRDCGYRNALLPITTGSISSPMGLGSNSLPVSIALFGQRTYLADSMQFLLEYAVRIVGRGAYYVMPSFRGEDVDRRHLSQFHHSEVEIQGGLDDIMDVASRYVRALARHMLATCPERIQAMAGTCAHVEALAHRKEPFVRVRFEDAVRLLSSEAGGVRDSGHGFAALTPEGEAALIQRLGDFVWVTHMPQLSVPFYQRQESGTASALAADLLAGIGEVIGCGERVLDGNGVLDALRQHGVDPTEYEWYVEMKSLYPCRTAGFGMGVERFLLWLTRTDDIRDCTLLLREKNRIHVP